MITLSGTALGMVLRAKKFRYKDIWKVSLVYTAFITILSIIVLALTNVFTTWTIDGTLSVLGLAGTWVASLTIGGFLFYVLSILIIAIFAFLSLAFGALVIDIADAIRKG